MDKRLVKYMPDFWSHSYTCTPRKRLSSLAVLWACRVSPSSSATVQTKIPCCKSWRLFGLNSPSNNANLGKQAA